MEKRVLKGIDAITDKLQTVTGKAFVCPRIDEDGFHAYYAESTEDYLRKHAPTVNIRWAEIADMLGYNVGELAIVGKRRFGYFEEDVEPRVGDKVIWRDPETTEEQDGYTITSVNGEIITIHHDNGSEAEVMEHELTIE